MRITEKAFVTLMLYGIVTPGVRKGAADTSLLQLCGAVEQVVTGMIALIGHEQELTGYEQEEA